MINHLSVSILLAGLFLIIQGGYEMNYYEEAIDVMKKVYGNNVYMTIATSINNKPNARVVNLYYEEGYFYATTYALSTKVQEIAENPYIALNHNLFVAHGVAENIGHPLKPENASIREKLKEVFSAFYNRRVDENDENTCFLKITLNDALIFDNNYKYGINFDKKTATREDFVLDVGI